MALLTWVSVTSTGVSHVTVLSHVYVLHINEQGLATHLSVVGSSLNAGDPGNCQLQKVSRHLTYSRRTADILLGLVTSNCSITHTHTHLTALFPGLPG